MTEQAQNPYGTIDRQTHAAYTGDLRYLTDRGVADGAFVVTIYDRLSSLVVTVSQIHAEPRDGFPRWSETVVGREEVRRPLVHEPSLDYRAVAQETLNYIAAQTAEEA